MFITLGNTEYEVLDVVDKTTFQTITLSDSGEPVIANFDNCYIKSLFQVGLTDINVACGAGVLANVFIDESGNVPITVDGIVRYGGDTIGVIPGSTIEVSIESDLTFGFQFFGWSVNGKVVSNDKSGASILIEDDTYISTLYSRDNLPVPTGDLRVETSNGLFPDTDEMQVKVNDELITAQVTPIINLSPNVSTNVKIDFVEEYEFMYITVTYYCLVPDAEQDLYQRDIMLQFTDYSEVQSVELNVLADVVNNAPDYYLVVVIDNRPP